MHLSFFRAKYHSVFHIIIIFLKFYNFDPTNFTARVSIKKETKLPLIRILKKDQIYYMHDKKNLWAKALPHCQNFNIIKNSRDFVILITFLLSACAE